jgi:hypothetical protein
MRNSLLHREVVPFVATLAALTAAALAFDAMLHLFDVVWVGRYLGIPGTLLIIGSIGYSLRKRKVITAGTPVQFLRLHERLAWLGCLLVLVHAGIHFNGILAWLAVGAMMINVGSGLIGKMLLKRSRLRLEEAREVMRQRGLSADVMEDRLYWDSLTFDVIAAWRAVHYPITLAFAVLSTAHILAVFLFWGWR